MKKLVFAKKIIKSVPKYAVYISRKKHWDIEIIKILKHQIYNQDNYSYDAIITLYLMYIR